MKFIQQPVSLKHLAAVKVAIALWDKEKFFLAMPCTTKMSYRDLIDKYNKIEGKVIERVQMLPQPERLKEIILTVIKPIGLEIVKWIQYHCTYFYFYLSKSFRFCWTPQGTIDREKTAKLFVKNEHFDASIRFKMACFYCLVNNMQELWYKMPRSDRNDFLDSDPEHLPSEVNEWEVSRSNFLHPDHLPSEIIWELQCAVMCDVIHLRFGNRCNANVRVFNVATRIGSRSAVEYLFKKLSPVQRRRNLVNITKSMIEYHYSLPLCVSKYDCINILCFLLLQMDEEQEIELFRTCCFQVLTFFLEWPWQNLFMETATRVWVCLSTNCYRSVLSKIIDKIKDGFKDFDYHDLFEEFWKKIPIAARKSVIMERGGRALFTKLFKIKDGRNIKLILRDLTQEEQEEILTRSGMELCHSVISYDDLDLLKFYIQSCEPLEDVWVKIKGYLKKYITLCTSHCDAKKSKKIDKVFQLLDNIEPESDPDMSSKERSCRLIDRFFNINWCSCLKIKPFK